MKIGKTFHIYIIVIFLESFALNHCCENRLSNKTHTSLPFSNPGVPCCYVPGLISISLGDNSSIDTTGKARGRGGGKYSFIIKWF